VCHNEIPDIFRQLRFDPIIEPELADAEGTDGEFQDFLYLYRHASFWFGFHLLEEAQCLTARKGTNCYGGHKWIRKINRVR
jgi:hypothetical protein